MVGSAAGIVLNPHKKYQRAARANAAHEHSSHNPAITMPLTALRNIGRFHSSLFKGTMVDMPLAVTEGLLAMPKLCGDPQSEHAPVIDAKSGFVIAGKVSHSLVSR